MAVTKKQKALLLAVKQRQIAEVRRLLEEEDVSPNFPNYSETTPLHEAVRQGSLAMVKLLTDAGAIVNCSDADWQTPRMLAQAGYGGVSQILSDYLDQVEEQDIWGGEPGTPQSRKKPRKKETSRTFNALARKLLGDAAPAKSPKLTAKTLPLFFAPEKWVDKADKMQELWDKVPRTLKKKFDFAASLAEVRQKSLKKNTAGRIILKRDTPPPAPDVQPKL